MRIVFKAAQCRLIFVRKYTFRSENNLLKISKAEAFYLRDHGRWNDVHMSSQTHKKRGKRYWLTTAPKSMKLLEQFRKQEILEVHDGR